jgi:hypothetical protein
VFEAALADPDSLADVVTVDDADEAECEAMLGAARDAYRRATSADLPMDSIIRLPELGDSWDFDDEAECRRRYPRLTEIFFRTQSLRGLTEGSPSRECPVVAADRARAQAV